jgi:hypothetical protein
MRVDEQEGVEQGFDEDDWVEPEEDVEMVRHRGLILAMSWSTRREDWLKAIRPRSFRYQGCVVVEPGDLAEFLAAMRRDGLEVVKGRPGPSTRGAGLATAPAKEGGSRGGLPVPVRCSLGTLPGAQDPPEPGQVPQMGRGSTQPAAPASKSVGFEAIRETHHPERSWLNNDAP